MNEADHEADLDQVPASAQPTDHGSDSIAPAAETGATNANGLTPNTGSIGVRLGNERLPMLDAVFVRLGKSLETTIRKTAGEEASVRVTPIEFHRYDEYLKSAASPVLIGIVRVDGSTVPCLAFAGPDFVLAAIDMLLGSGNVPSPAQIERPFTLIERMLSERLMRLVLADLTIAFQPVVDLRFRLDRVESSPTAAAAIGLNEVIVAVQAQITVRGTNSELHLIFSSACLEPYRDHLRQAYMGEKFGHDEIWEKHLTQELLASQIHLTAVLDEPIVPISSLIRWQVGSTLMLDATPTSHVKVYCGAAPRFLATMGRNRDRVVVRIEGGFERPGGIAHG